MQSTVEFLTRIVSRTLVNNLVNGKLLAEEVSSSRNTSLHVRTRTNNTYIRSLSTAKVKRRESLHENVRLLTAVSGFPKSQDTFNIDHILKGQIGEDAYFIARHVDDWSDNGTLVDRSPPVSTPVNSVSNQPSPLSSSSSTVPSATNLRTRIHSYRRNEAGDGADQTVEKPHQPLSSDNNSSPTSDSTLLNGLQNSIKNDRQCTVNSADVIGVADGVGSWRNYGIDPGEFSMQLMQNCKRLVTAGNFLSDQPVQLLSQGFSEMQECKKPAIGSSTACLAILNHSDGKLYSANIGDSGLLVVRNGKIVHRSSEQTHCFNTPFQLSLPPSRMKHSVLTDPPESADKYEFKVEDGDVIILATDGLFDNVPDRLLVKEINSIKGCTNDQVKIQECCNTIAFIARNLSRDEYVLSPFARNAILNGYVGMRGGKEDDITVVLAAVNLENNYETSSS